MPDLDELLDQVPALAGPRRVEELAGGLTNRNFKVTAGGSAYVVRRWHGDASLLAIDRDHEHLNSVAAAQAGVGAEVVDYRPDLGILVIGFLEGRTLKDADFADPEVLGRAADACRRLHAGPRFGNDFDMFSRQAGYLETVKQGGFPLPTGYDDHAGRWDDVRRVLTATAGPTVPCNNDLLAGNFIDDGDRIWLIDYEYSGNNDPCFELGNTTTECEFTAGADGRPTPRPTSADPRDDCWPGCGCRRCAASTAGRCGGSSRPRPAPSSSTSKRGGCTATRRRPAPSPARCSTA